MPWRGGTAQGIFLTVDNRKKADDPDVADRMGECSGFFFTGGAQSRIMEVFRPEGEGSLAFQALRERFQAGAVISGSSAGAAIMTDPMIAGGSSGEALRQGIRNGEEGEGVSLQEGMGFLGGALVDQHFLARGRWGRLLVALLGTEGNPFGFGIDENTGVVVRGDMFEVIGQGYVAIYDAGSWLEGGPGGEGGPFYFLAPGDRFNLKSREAFRPAATLEPLERVKKLDRE